MVLEKFEEETEKYLDGLRPNEIAEAFVNANNDERVIYGVYISKQQEERSEEIRDSINNVRLRMR